MNSAPSKSGLNEGCNGTKLSVQLFNEMRRRKQKYGVVTIPHGRDWLCVGTGQGAASVFELLNTSVRL